MDAQQQNQQSINPTVMADPADVEKNKVFGIIAYLGILFLVPLLAAKDSKFAKFHANQGLIVFLMWFVLTFVYYLPLPGILNCLILPLNIIPFGFAILGIINAANGQMKRLPIIGEYDLIK